MLTKLPKTPPHYRKVPNTNYIVDCFGIESQGYIFFLTHFHADHYGGLNKKFSSIIYCSKTTANLAKKLAKKECLYSLDLYQWYKIEKSNYVLLLDANHCPGAVCFVFCINGLFYFHTGDFRCENEFYKQFEHAKISADIIELPLHANNNQDTNCNSVKEETHYKLPVTNIMQIGYDRLYIDNTYEGYRPFDTQEQIIHNVLSIIEKKIYDRNVLVPINYCFMFATYSVGKEKIFLSVAEHFDFDIFVSKYKMDLISCIDTADRTKIDGQVKDILRSYKSKKCENTKSRNLVESQFTGIKRFKLNNNDDRSCTQERHNIGFENVFDRFTMTCTNNSIHIISMMHLNKAKLEGIVKKLKYDKIVIIAGTGWKDMTRYYDWEREDGRKINKGIEVIYVPYSEHSSDNELKEFKTKLKCKKTVNTVKNKY